MDESFPLTEEEGERLKPFEFTIKNVCKMSADYQVNIEKLDVSTLSTDYIRYKLDDNHSNILGEQLEVEQFVNNNVSESRNIDVGILLPNEEKTYNLRLWIDEDTTTEESANKEFRGKVVINSIVENNPYQRITLNTNGGTISNNEVLKIKKRSIGNLEEPTRDGYIFDKWYLDSEFNNGVDNNTIVNSDLTDLYAKWIPRDDIPYKVEHYQMNTSGSYASTPTETQNLIGTTDTSVSPSVKSYTGFTSPSVQTVNVNGDGSRVVKYYYTRNKYTQTTQGRYMNSAGNYGSYGTLETKDVYYGASYSYSKAATTEYNAASVTAYTVTGAKTNSINISRKTYAQTTQGRYMNTSGSYGNYSTLETKNVYYGASYSYSKAATAEYNAASVAAYTVSAAKTNSISFSRRTYTITVSGSNTSKSASSLSVYYGASKTVTITPSYNHYLSSASCNNGYTTTGSLNTYAAQTVTIKNNSKGSNSTCTYNASEIKYTASRSGTTVCLKNTLGKQFCLAKGYWSANGSTAASVNAKLKAAMTSAFGYAPSECKNNGNENFRCYYGEDARCGGGKNGEVYCDGNSNECHVNYDGSAGCS